MSEYGRPRLTPKIIELWWESALQAHDQIRELRHAFWYGLFCRLHMSGLLATSRTPYTGTGSETKDSLAC
jgi:hypothetical protein